MTRRERRRVATMEDWRLSGLLILGLAVALWGLSSVLEGVAWWFSSVAIACLIFLVSAVLRTVRGGRVLPLLFAGLAALVAITFLFARDTAALLVVPTADTWSTFRELFALGNVSIAEQSIPAQATPEILFLLCIAIAGFAFVMEFFTFVLRVPALAGVPLLVVVLLPALLNPELENALLFVVVAVIYLMILRVRKVRSRPGSVLAIGGVAIVAALLLPITLPSTGDPTEGGVSGGLSNSINPILDLGQDLRRPAPSPVLSYSSTLASGSYLRLSVLDDFSQDGWEPRVTGITKIDGTEQIGPVPGLGDAVAREFVETEIRVGDVRSRWLPTPYAPSRIEGLTGQWFWEERGLTVRSERTSMRGQEYTVQSTVALPTTQQLLDSGVTVDEGFDRYLELPEDVPAIVTDTALEVTAAATTNFEKAIALQKFFRSAEFRYSEDTPVEEGFDGTGLEAMAVFLEARSGYCVHFSSSMAVMARSLGIPARVIVGFTPGTPEPAMPGTIADRTVTTSDLHAWPELYFSGTGWVRFEPTPGRGVVPVFATPPVDDPATPDVDEAHPTPVPTATPAPATTGAPVGPDIADGPGAAVDTGWGPAQWSLLAGGILVLLLLSPSVIRILRRSERYSRLESGKAGARVAWQEILDTAGDLGLRPDHSNTPRQAAIAIAPGLDQREREALARTCDALEHEVFGESPGFANSADVRAVVEGLRREVGFGRRLRAVLLPVSLVSDWWWGTPRED